MIRKPASTVCALAVPPTSSGRLTATEFDHVHGGHAVTGAIHHTTLRYRPVSMKLEVVFTGFYFGGILQLPPRAAPPGPYAAGRCRPGSA